MPVLQAKNLRKSFGSSGKRVEAVKGVSLVIEPGEILAFLGRNGAGKTTTIKMIAGLLHPDEGVVEINGRSPHHDADVYTELGTVFEGSRNLYLQLTARENLEYFASLKKLNLSQSRARATELLKLFELEHKANARVRELSRGMQQRLSIAVSIVHNPKLLLLDEPTNGLDVESSENIKGMMRKLTKEGHAILLTTHQLDVAQAVSDRVAIIRDGEIIAEGRTDELIRQFSGGSFTVKYEGALSAQQAGDLALLGAQVEDGKVVATGDGEYLYKVLDAVRPNPITSVDRGGADLTEIFLRLVQQGQGQDDSTSSGGTSK